jgi:acyl-coenzyme A synthetase/AMP-(fatty) acid ligase
MLLPFLIDPQSGIRVTYQNLAADLIAGQVEPLNGAEAKSSTTLWRLYQQLVLWLGQIVRNQPEVNWPDVDFADSPLPSLTPLPPDQAEPLESIADASLHQSLDAWRSAFQNSTSRIALQTSGSSGKPKLFWHSMTSLTRGLKLSENQRGSVWGWAYPPDHLAGMQVLFQALLNANPLVRLFQVPSSSVHQALDDYEITHLSCTPTFLRLLLADGRTHPTLQRLTSGGERLDQSSMSRIAHVFPNARLTNIYASTEVGPLLVSHEDSFTVPEWLRNQVRIVDGQLWLHRCLRLEGSEESIAESLEESSIENSEFWPTGDQVEVVEAHPLRIRFVSRSHEGFNVAGYRVDPVKLENIARTHPTVADARFYGVPNSVTEHIVACDLVSVPGKQPVSDIEWRSWISGQVQRHELPRVIRWVTKIDTTNSGKIKRE